MAKVEDSKNNAVREEMAKVLASPMFIRGERLSRFLRYIVEETLAGREDALKELVLGRDVFDRGENFDPRNDSIVRVEATRLRNKLMEYYAGVPEAGLRIELPKGAYVAQFTAADKPVQRTSRRSWIIGAGIAASLATGVALYEKLGKRSARESSNPEAARLYLEAHRLLAQSAPINHHPDQLPKWLADSIPVFERVVELDPSFGGGWASLADVYLSASDHYRSDRWKFKELARAAAKRALEISSDLTEGHEVLGVLAMYQDWRFPAAVRELAQVSKLAPRSSTASRNYGSALAVMGRFEEALVEISRRELESPDAGEIPAVRAQLHFLTRRYSDAQQAAMRAVSLNRRDRFARWVLGVSTQLLGDFDGAARAYQEILDIDPMDGRAAPAMAQLLAQRGKGAEGIAMIEGLVERWGSAAGWQSSRAMVLSAGGDANGAAAALREAFAWKEATVPFMLLDARFDVIRRTDEFRRLAVQLNSSPLWNSMRG